MFAQEISRLFLFSAKMSEGDNMLEIGQYTGKLEAKEIRLVQIKVYDRVYSLN